MFINWMQEDLWMFNSWVLQNISPSIAFHLAWPISSKPFSSSQLDWCLGAPIIAIENLPVDKTILIFATWLSRLILSTGILGEFANFPILGSYNFSLQHWQIFYNSNFSGNQLMLTYRMCGSTLSWCFQLIRSSDPSLCYIPV